MSNADRVRLLRGVCRLLIDLMHLVPTDLVGQILRGRRGSADHHEDQ